MASSFFGNLRVNRKIELPCRLFELEAILPKVNDMLHSVERESGCQCILSDRVDPPGVRILGRSDDEVR